MSFRSKALTRRSPRSSSSSSPVGGRSFASARSGFGGRSRFRLRAFRSCFISTVFPSFLSIRIQAFTNSAGLFASLAAKTQEDRLWPISVTTMSRLASLNPANRTPASPSSRAAASPSRNTIIVRDPTTFHSILRDINNEVRVTIETWDEICVRLFGSAKGVVDEGTEIE
jgi:hypothetical protein